MTALEPELTAQELVDGVRELLAESDEEVSPDG